MLNAAQGKCIYKKVLTADLMRALRATECVIPFRPARNLATKERIKNLQLTDWLPDDSVPPIWLAVVKL